MDLRAVAHWTAKHLDSLTHEHRVYRIAATLFDLTRDLHGLDASARHLLRAAAIVHDVGRSIDKADHPAIGARLILRDRSLPVGEGERRKLAFLTRYHRDGVPSLEEDGILRDWDDPESMRLILALLRVADALDSRSKESPRLVFGLKKKRLKITCYFEELTAKTKRIYQRRKKFRLFEEELGCAIEVDVRKGEALKLVA
jgi:exopolyphosphatase/guanosine-5'-triphosphate,3'-diphosphate pyrophosphatase